MTYPPLSTDPLDLMYIKGETFTPIFQHDVIICYETGDHYEGPSIGQVLFKETTQEVLNIRVPYGNKGYPLTIEMYETR